MTPARDRIARILMIALGLASVGAFVNAAFEFGSIPPERVHVEAWRLLAFPVFAGLFILLGLYPRRMTGIWELVLYHKAAVPLFLAFVVGTGTGATASFTDAAMFLVDSGLTAITLLCYMLTEGWRAWLPQH